MAMRNIWSGSLSFGLVNIPVKLYPAAEEGGFKFNYLHKDDLSPIRYARICKADGREISYEEMVKGYEYQKGDFVVLTEEDFKKANVRKTKAIDIVEFAKEAEIDSAYFERPYYLEPEAGAEKAYTLLREALKRSKKVGIARFVIRNREHIGIIKPDGKVLVLNQMRFKNEIRDTAPLSLPDEKVSAKEIDMALQLIDKLTEPFKPEDYKDTYTEELEQIIEEKKKGKEPKPKGKEPQPTKVPDLMNALKASLEKNKKQFAAP